MVGLVEGKQIQQMRKEAISHLFPNLRSGTLRISSDASVEYNCIAWAAEDTEAQWWPDPMEIGYWPPGVERTETLNAFIDAFGSLGYELCGNSEYEEGYEKVAIFVDSGGTPTHAARQLGPSVWTSKLGRIEDIEHELEGLSGKEYGRPAAFMRRRRTDTPRNQ